MTIEKSKLITEFIENLNNADNIIKNSVNVDDSFSIIYKKTKKSFIASRVNKKNYIRETIRYIHCDTGISRIESDCEIEESLLFFRKRNITVLYDKIDNEFMIEIKNYVKKYIDINLNEDLKLGNMRISFIESFYFVIINSTTIETVKTLIIKLTKSSILIDKLKIDFFNTHFKFAAKNLDYNEKNKDRIFKLLRITSSRFMKNFANDIGVDLNHKNIDEKCEILNLMKY